MENIEQIRSRIGNHFPKPIDNKGSYSVLIPLIEVDGEIHIIYERRAKTLKRQPYEVSFPGGAIELGETPEEAAVRETAEELLIDESKIEVIGRSDYIVKPEVLIIYTYVGIIKEDIKKIVPNRDEVEYIFTVPLKYLMENEPKSFPIELKITRTSGFPYDLIPDGKKYEKRMEIETVEAYQYEDDLIWGFTAKTTRAFIEILKNKNSSLA